MALFESYERREKQILAKLAEYGINSIEEAAEKGTIICMLLSDAGQIQAWPTIKKYLTPGKTLYYSHGFAINWSDRTGVVPPADIVEDDSLTVIDKFKLHGALYIEHLTGGSALHMNLEEHLSKQQYAQLLRVAAKEGCNYFTFNIPNTVCNDCGHIDKRYLKECPHCHSKNIDYMTRIIGYLKRVSNFSKPRQEEASRRYYAQGKM